jgi:hypothetical protein
VIDDEVLALLTWSALLGDVELEDAKAAVIEHYRTSKEAIMPADILARVVADAPSPYRNVTAELIDAAKKRALEAANVTEADYEAHRNDEAWLLAHFPKEISA